MSLPLLGAPALAAASPPTVFVRVEGATTTLLPQTAVRTTAARTVEREPCSGSSAAGALDLATRRNWSGSYSKQYRDFFVTTILGETPSGNDYWSLWINGISSPSGACSTKLHPGDRELWFHCIPNASFSCTNDPLSLSGPATDKAGRRVTLSVTQLDGAGHSTPFAGATVRGGELVTVSRSGGRATVRPRTPGVITLQAVSSRATASDPVTLCVYRRSVSECRMPGPPVHISGIRNGEVFVHGPRQLRGTAGPDRAGLTGVRLALKRRVGADCSYFDGNSARWRAIACKAFTPRFSIGASESWSYFLPAALPQGSYRLGAFASDAAGRTGSQTVRFSVRAARAADTAAAHSVQIMVVGHSRTLVGARTVRLAHGSVTVGHKHCAVPANTALAGLVATGLKLRVSDAGGCDPTQLFVTRVGPDSNHGGSGWEYKVGHLAPSFGAGDPAGSVRSGAQLLWFWCVSANACERTLAISTRLSGHSLRVRVRGYDDSGHAVAVAAATVHIGSMTRTTNASGIATATLPRGRYQVFAVKPRLVRSFATEVNVTT